MALSNMCYLGSSTQDQCQTAFLGKKSIDLPASLKTEQWSLTTRFCTPKVSTVMAEWKHWKYNIVQWAICLYHQVFSCFYENQRKIKPKRNGALTKKWRAPLGRQSNTADFLQIYFRGKHFISSTVEWAEAYFYNRKGIKSAIFGRKVNLPMFLKNDLWEELWCWCFQLRLHMYSTGLFHMNVGILGEERRYY